MKEASKFFTRIFAGSRWNAEILQEKGFVGHEPDGKSHKYHPLITKENYTKSFMKGFVKKYFGGSYQQMVSFFTKEDNLSLEELEQLIKELKAK